MYNIFKQVDVNTQLAENGFAVVPFADKGTLDALATYYQQLQNPEAKGTYVTMFNPSDSYRINIDAKIRTLCAPIAEGMMDGYRVLYTNFMVKQPGPEGDFPVHQDWTYVDETKYPSIAFWIPMQDVDNTNGALHVVKGSHKFGTRLRGPFVHEPFGNLSADIKSKFSQAINLKAGEALVWDHRLIHFSLPNLSTNARMAFTLILIPKHAQAWHCYSQPHSGGEIVEKYAVDTNFYMDYKIGSKPEGVPLVDTVKQPAKTYSLQEFEAMFGCVNNAVV